MAPVSRDIAMLIPDRVFLLFQEEEEGGDTLDLLFCFFSVGES